MDVLRDPFASFSGNGEMDTNFGIHPGVGNANAFGDKKKTKSAPAIDHLEVKIDTLSIRFGSLPDRSRFQPVSDENVDLVQQPDVTVIL